VRERNGVTWHDLREGRAGSIISREAETNMIKITLLYAAALIIVGVGGYWYSGFASVTALIPGFIGAIFLALALAARSPKRRKVVMHVACGLAVLGFLGTLMGIPGAIRHLSGGEVDRPLAKMSQAATAVLSLGFVICCFASFLRARSQRAG
jgi:hypothetical protein